MKCPKCSKKMSETTDSSCFYYCKKCGIYKAMFATDKKERKPKLVATEFTSRRIVLRRMRSYIDALKLDMNWLDNNL